MTTEKKQRIYAVGKGALNADERLDLVRLLAKAGYTVRVGSERQNGKSTNIFFVEFWTE